MSSQNLCTSSVMAGLLAVAILWVVPLSNGASAGQSALKHRDSGRTYMLENRRRARTQKIPLPVGPAYIYYDYPYYYSRGFYPTHIGGYTYYYPSSGRTYFPGYTGRCADGSRKCAVKRRNNR